MGRRNEGSGLGEGELHTINQGLGQHMGVAISPPPFLLERRRLLGYRLMETIRLPALKSAVSRAAWLALIACAALLLSGAAAAATSPAAGVAAPQHADFGGIEAAPDVRQVADWAVRTRDHKALPFAVIDKVNARLYAFDARGVLLEATPVLIGMGIGDTFPHGVIDMDMYDTKPWQRVTPAGRFEADVFEKGRGRSTLWVDYDTGIALHKMPTKKTAQRRAERMKSADPAAHRITYGCINVPPKFYDAVVYPAFKPRGGIVYVLPERLPLRMVFKSYNVGEAVHLRHTRYISR